MVPKDEWMHLVGSIENNFKIQAFDHFSCRNGRYWGIRPVLFLPPRTNFNKTIINKENGPEESARCTWGSNLAPWLINIIKIATWT